MKTIILLMLSVFIIALSAQHRMIVNGVEQSDTCGKAINAKGAVSSKWAITASGLANTPVFEWKEKVIPNIKIGMILREQLIFFNNLQNEHKTVIECLYWATTIESGYRTNSF